MPPVNLVGAGLEMVGAESGKALQHGVDLDLGGEESDESFGVVGRAAGHPGGSLVGLHCCVGPAFALVAILIN